jgi:hypothetical protein
MAIWVPSHHTDDGRRHHPTDILILQSGVESRQIAALFFWFFREFRDWATIWIAGH